MEVGTAIPNELDGLMSEYENLKNRIKILKDEKENLKAKMLINIKVNDVDRYVSPDRLKLTFTKQKRMSWDKVKIEHYCEKHGMQVEDLKKTNEFESLRISQLAIEEEKDCGCDIEVE